MKRRTFLNGVLKGSAFSIGLPVFEAMLGINGEAFADGTDIPTRFGIWFWGNGVRPEKWTPTTTGEHWIPNEETLPLLSHQAYLSIVSGCEIKTATHPHHSGMAGILKSISENNMFFRVCAGAAADHIAKNAIRTASDRT